MTKTRFARLLIKLATANGAKYLVGLNLKKLNEAGRPEGVEPRTYYQGLQEQAKAGPIFSAKTVQYVEAMDLDLEKNELQWFATNLEIAGKAPDANGLQSALDYIRAEKPELHGLTFEKALEESVRWHRQFAKKKPELGKYKHNKVVLECGDLRWVLVSLADLKAEGDQMGHCVGGGGYERGVKNKTIRIYSLRDRKNEPHVTVEYNVRHNSFIQVQGKQNDAPVVKYHPAIGALVDKLAVRMDDVSLQYLSNPKTISKLFDENLQNPKRSSKDLLESLAENSNLPVPYMEKIVNADNKKLSQCLLGLLRNPSIPPELLLKISERPGVGSFALYHANMPVDALVTKVSEARKAFQASQKLPKKKKVKKPVPKNRTKRKYESESSSEDVAESALGRYTNMATHALLHPKLPYSVAKKIVADEKYGFKILDEALMFDEAAQAPGLFNLIFSEFSGKQAKSLAETALDCVQLSDLPKNFVSLCVDLPVSGEWLNNLADNDDLDEDTQIKLVNLGSRYAKTIAGNWEASPKILEVILDKYPKLASDVMDSQRCTPELTQRIMLSDYTLAVEAIENGEECTLEFLTQLVDKFAPTKPNIVCDIIICGLDNVRGTKASVLEKWAKSCVEKYPTKENKRALKEYLEDDY